MRTEKKETVSFTLRDLTEQQFFCIRIALLNHNHPDTPAEDVACMNTLYQEMGDY